MTGHSGLSTNSVASDVMQTLPGTKIHSQTAFRHPNQDTPFPSTLQKQQKQYLSTQIRPLEHPNQLTEAPNQYKYILSSPVPSSPPFWLAYDMG